MSTTLAALLHFVAQDATEVDTKLDLNDVYSGTSATKAHESCSQEMLRLVGQTGTLLLCLATLATYLNW